MPHDTGTWTRGSTVTYGYKWRVSSIYRTKLHPFWLANPSTVPDALRPGYTNVAAPVTAQAATDVMKPGWSSQNTPRSSIDSKESRDFWESSDDEDEKEKGKLKDKEKDTNKQATVTSESTEDLVILVGRFYEFLTSL